MARTIRKTTDNLEQMLQDLKIGEPPILDTESGYDITRVVSGFIYRNEYTSKFEKLSSGHRTGKGQFSFQSQRKAMPKNAQTTAQLHSSHTLVK